MTSETPLSDLLTYAPETGVLTWKVRRGGIKAGTTAGRLDVDGYRRVMVNGKDLKAHRLAFLFMTGKWPELPIDHLNGVKDDNRWANLRDVSPQTNNQNLRKAKACSATGLLGVSPSPNGKGFISQIRLGGKKVYLGTFDTSDEAHQAYLDSKRNSHEGCTL